MAKVQNDLLSLRFSPKVKPALWTEDINAMRRVRQLRTQIENELRCWPPGGEYQEFEKEQKLQNVNAKT